jgi:hypothetical protein
VTWFDYGYCKAAARIRFRPDIRIGDLDGNPGQRFPALRIVNATLYLGGLSGWGKAKQKKGKGDHVNSR